MSSKLNPLQEKLKNILSSKATSLQIKITNAGEGSSSIEFVKQVDLSAGYLKTVLTQLGRPKDYIVSPHSFMSDEIVNISAGDDVDIEGCNPWENSTVCMNAKALQHWAKNWFENNSSKFSQYSVTTGEDMPMKKAFYRKLLYKPINKNWDLVVLMARAKRYCFLPGSDVTRRDSLQKLFDCIFARAIRLSQDNIPKELKEEEFGSLNISENAMCTFDKPIEFTDIVIFMEPHDMEDLKNAKFNLKDLIFDVIPKASLLPGEFIIGHRNLNVHIKDVDEELSKFELCIDDKSYVLHYGMPKKFCASESAYDTMFTGPYQWLANFKGKVGVL